MGVRAMLRGDTGTHIRNSDKRKQRRTAPFRSSTGGSLAYCPPWQQNARGKAIERLPLTVHRKTSTDRNRKKEKLKEKQRILPVSVRQSFDFLKPLISPWKKSVFLFFCATSSPGICPHQEIFLFLPDLSSIVADFSP